MSPCKIYISISRAPTHEPGQERDRDCERGRASEREQEQRSVRDFRTFHHLDSKASRRYGGGGGEMKR